MRAVDEVRFPAMGTEAHVIVVDGGAGLIDRARRRIAQLEDRWSRFRPASDVSVMNAMAGMPVRVAPETIQLVRRALAGYRLTGGRFDPTVLGAVVRAGYERSYEQLTTRGTAPTNDEARERGADGIVVDHAAGTVTVPDGVGFDPGGIGKGLAADLIVAELLDAGAGGVCVNLGGDLRVAGTAPAEEGWIVEVEHPFGDGPAAILSLRSGAVATTSRVKRRLGAHGERHHLIDPRIGASASSGLASATTIAAQGWQAEVLAKAVFLAGPDDGLRLLAGVATAGGPTPWSGTTGLLVRDDGTVLRAPGLERYAGPVAVASSTGGAW